MLTTEESQNEKSASTFIFINCEKVFDLIKEGKIKQAEELFPLEYYLIQKYQHKDFKDFSELLSKRLMIK